MESWGMEWADVYFGLRGAHNLYELSDISPEKLAANQSAMGAVSSQRWKKTRWCLVRVPNESFAQQAHTNYEIIEEMFFSSCFIDWKQKSFTWNKWALQLGKGKYIQIVGKGTDLSFSTEGRKWIPFAGKNNMPDGEIATAPIISTVNGTITFEHPGILGGRFVHDIRLTWEKGVLTDAHSSSEQAFFQSILSKDKGAACIGEFALGTNFNITRFCNDILIDEKIGGTIHIALGRAYPECGGKNVSSIHWDIIKDIRKDGCVLLDGMPIVKKGNILL
jgi:aminopeptidase